MRHLFPTVVLFSCASLSGCDSETHEIKGSANRTASQRSSLSISSEPSDSRPERPAVFSQNTEETRHLLKELVLDELNFEEMPLPEAIHEINRLLGKKFPGQKRPKICLADEWTDNPSLKIQHLRLRDVPLGIALRSICDQTRCVFWVYQGTVYLDIIRYDDPPEERFLHQIRIPSLDIPDASLPEALEALRSAIDQIDFNGRKPPITMQLTPGEWNEIGSENSVPRVRGVSLRDATVGEALAEIRKQTGVQQETWEGEIVFTPKRLPKNPSDRTPTPK